MEAGVFHGCCVLHRCFQADRTICQCIKKLAQLNDRDTVACHHHVCFAFIPFFHDSVLKEKSTCFDPKYSAHLTPNNSAQSSHTPLNLQFNKVDYFGSKKGAWWGTSPFTCPVPWHGNYPWLWLDRVSLLWLCLLLGHHYISVSSTWTSFRHQITFFPISLSYNAMASFHALAQFLKYKVSPKTGHFLFSHLSMKMRLCWMASWADLFKSLQCLA